MKRLLLFFSFILSCVVSNAQIRYLPTTNSSQPLPDQQYQAPQPQEQLYSTMAYYKSDNGYGKLPIKVAVTENGRIVLKQYYQQTLVGGDWRQFGSANRVQKCTSLFNEPLESQFMYKCQLVSPVYAIIYFDL